MTLGSRWRSLAALCLGSASLISQAAMEVAPGAQPVQARCEFEAAPGLEFRFSTADEILQPYGYVLWKTAPSLRGEPLAYAAHSGQRGKLSGGSIVREGVRWFEGVLEDCTRIYAEDASRHSRFAAVDHLAFFGKAVFVRWREDAARLIGRQVVVNGAGLEPRQRLYTSLRGRDYPLADGERLTVTGIDAHRYAHAKGVGPLFLRVTNAAGQAGLIKYNPRYLNLPQGTLALRSLAPQPRFAQAGEGRPAGPAPRLRSYVLTVSHFLDEQAGLVAERKLEQDGFNARLLPFGEDDGSVIYKLQIAGLASPELAQDMARMLATRFEWVGGRGPLAN